jgi:hypothetical protein
MTPTDFFRRHVAAEAGLGLYGSIVPNQYINLRRHGL